MDRRLSLAALATSVLAALSLYVSVYRFRNLPLKALTQPYSYIGDDFPELWDIPVQQPVAMLVQESRAYPIHGDDALERWATTSSDGFGYVRLGEEQRAFAIAMFHEMHCVRLMRAALSGRYDAAAQGHMHHCLNYIRQFILCSPDLTLEPPDVLSRDFEAERVGSTHVCADWSLFYQVAADNFDTFMDSRSNSSVS